MSLRAKLLLCVIPLIIGPLLGLWWIADGQLDDSAEQTFERQIDALLRQASLAAQAHRRTALANTRLVADSGPLTSFLLAQGSAQADVMLPPLLKRLASYHEAHPDYVEIRVLGAQGQTLAHSASGELATSAIEDGTFLQHLRNSEAQIYAEYVRSRSGKPLLLLGHKLFFVDSIGEDRSTGAPPLRGYLIVSVTLEMLRRQVEDVVIGVAGGLMLADFNGDRFFPAPRASSPAEPGESIRHQMHAAASTGAARTAELGGVPTLIRAQQLAPNLFLVALLPQAELSATADAVGQIAARVGLVAVLIGAPLLLAVVHLLVTRPLRRLEHGAAAIGAGDLQVHLPIRGRDELTRLARALNRMASRLQEAERNKDQPRG